MILETDELRETMPIVLDAIGRFIKARYGTELPVSVLIHDEDIVHCISSVPKHSVIDCMREIVEAADIPITRLDS